MPVDPTKLRALAARAEAETRCKIGEIRPTATGCGWERPADKYVFFADANQRVKEAFIASNPFAAWLYALAATSERAP